MFWLMSVFGGCGCVACIMWAYNERKNRTIATVLAVACFVIFAGSWYTSSGEIYYKQLFASTVRGSWMVVDNSGGKTMRHWILKNAYVTSSNHGGWQFTDIKGNLCYVSGDAFTMQIKEPIKLFIQDYKEKYNIPNDQKALE